MLHKWLGILGQRSCEDDQLIYLVHSFKELGYMRPYQDVDSADLPFNLNLEHDVGILNGLKRGVHQGLVEVKHKSLTASF